jgi:hypothetical protein
MSSFNAVLLDSVVTGSPQQAWQDIADYMWQSFSAPLPKSGADAEVVKRDRSITELENTLSGSCWDLWSSFDSCVPKASSGLIEFWSRIQGGKAILVLDGVSLRETPCLLAQASERGFTVHHSSPKGSELPCETTPFARSLGFAQRSALENNGAGGAHKLSGASTESSNLNWKDCIGLVSNHPNVLFWHHYPDARMHDLSVPGEGLHKLAREIHEQFMSDDFWAFVERLATGRRLVITSDHGYAACGLFPDLVDKDQVEYMKKLFKSGRTASSDCEDGAWIPPIDLRLVTSHGSHRYVLGRRKWKSGGGYPTLHHGGLSLLEVFVPFIELSK